VCVCVYGVAVDARAGGCDAEESDWWSCGASSSGQGVLGGRQARLRFQHQSLAHSPPTLPPEKPLNSSAAPPRAATTTNLSPTHFRHAHSADQSHTAPRSNRLRRPRPLAFLRRGGLARPSTRAPSQAHTPAPSRSHAVPQRLRNAAAAGGAFLALRIDDDDDDARGGEEESEARRLACSRASLSLSLSIDRSSVVPRPAPPAPLTPRSLDDLAIHSNP